MADGTHAREFLGQWDALPRVDVGGKTGVAADSVRDLVRKYPDAAAAIALAAARLASQQAGYRAMAEIIAGAYQAALDDDSVSIAVEETLAGSGLALRPLEFVDDPEAPQLQKQPETFQFRVDRQMVDDLDTFPFVLLFGHGAGSNPEQTDRMRHLAGHCLIAFDGAGKDPREVWQIPAIRAYMAQLNALMPYLPYFLEPSPSWGMIFMWLACLAPEHAILGTVGLDLRADEVAATMAHLVSAVSEFAAVLDDDPDASVARLFSGLPVGYAAVILPLVAALDETP